MGNEIEILRKNIFVSLSFDLSEQLLFPLDLEDHLAMDVFYIKVFSRDHQ
jgi:hypothetical protein